MFWKVLVLTLKERAVRSSVTESVVSSHFTVPMIRDRRIYFHLSFV